MKDKASKTPKGKFAATVRVGERGQIVIPKGARDMFDIKAGDTLLVLADIKRGIAIMQYDTFEAYASKLVGADLEHTGPETDD